MININSVVKHMSKGNGIEEGNEGHDEKDVYFRKTRNTVNMKRRKP